MAAFGGRGLSVPTDRGKRGQDTRYGFLSPLDSPYLPLSRRIEDARLNGGYGGLGSGRLSAYMQLSCPEFSLRGLPRITVRGQTVQGGSVLLRKAPPRSRVCPWNTKRPCGPLAFRRATEGSRVQRKGWGVKRGRETLVSLPLLPPPPGGGNAHAMSWRTSPRPGRASLACGGKPPERRNRSPSAEGKEERRRRPRGALIPPRREAPSRRPPHPPGMPPHAHACRSLPPPECPPRTRPAPLPTRPPAPRARAPRSDRGTWS